MTEFLRTPGGAGRVLTTAELRESKPDRLSFAELPRRPVRLILDGVRQPSNIGAIFRLCDAMLVERLVICGTKINLKKRKLVQTGRGTQNWVPWEEVATTVEAIAAARAAGFQIVIAEITTTSMRPEQLPIDQPLCFVLGDERSGLSQATADLADWAVAIPMLGMGNSLNVATVAAILLYRAPDSSC